jgi:uncharacterized membrane protein YqaE (UPF0057 family)
MKRNYIFLSLCLTLTFLISSKSFAARPNGNLSRSGQTALQNLNVKDLSKESPSGKDRSCIKAEKKNQKILRQEIKDKLQNARKNKSDVDEVVLILLAIFIPPVAVYLVDDLTTPFWIDLILTLLFFLPGIIFALYRVLKSGGKI